MKKISIIIAVLFLSISAYAQNDAIATYFEKYVDDEDFSVVYISGRMFSMFSDVEDDDKEAKEVINKIKGLKILTTDKKDGTVLYKEAIQKFKISEYEEIMNIRDGKENVNFYIKEKDKIVKELLLLVGSIDNFVLISFIGDIDIKKISTISDSIDIDIDGLDQLDKLNE